VGDTLPVDTLPGDVVPPDTLPVDTLRADTLAGAEADSARLERVREELAGGGFPERDSVFRKLLEESGYRIVEYRGRDVEFEVPDRRIRLRDSAQANYGDAALRADTILYRARLQFMEARRGIRLVSPEQRQMTTDSVLYYDVSRLKGTVLGAHTSFAARGAEWQVEGDAIPVGSRTLYVNRGSFTSCDRPDPHYHFKAGKIKMVSQDVIVAWPVTFYISDVPVFWLPFFAQDIRPERRSGIVVPDIGFNDIVKFQEDDRRSFRGFGYYWAINRFMDAKFTVDWFSGNFTRLNGDYRYNFRKKFMDGRVNLSREWGDRGNNISLDVQHRQEFSPDTRLTANIRYVRSEELLQQRSFRTEEQTQDIASNVGLSHEFDFGSLEVSGRRQQFLGPEGRTDLTLPDLRLSLSPVTLFEAPRSQAGFFDNLTLSPGSFTFNRRERTREIGDDIIETQARLGPTIRIGELSVSTQSSFRQTETTPFETVVDTATGDTIFRGDLPQRLESTVDWSASTGYQIDLFGSTTLSPNVSLRKEWFRNDVPAGPVFPDTAPDTGGRFVGAPMRLNAGARLSTDIFAFFPGFGPFSSVRHKISPRFSWSYSPAVTPNPLLQDVRGTAATETRNTLTVNFSQTFEAKIPGREAAPRDREDGEAPGAVPEGRRAPPAEGDTAAAAGEAAAAPTDTVAARADTVRAPGDTAPGMAAPGDTTGAPADTAGTGVAERATGADGREDRGARDRSPRPERKVTLLAIRSSGLRFDFNEPGPALQTDRFTNDFSSDLFPRGFRIRIAHDLFEGSGEDRQFRPFLAQLTASMRLNSSTSLGELVGLGRGGGGGSRGRGRGPDSDVGEWDLSVDYTLRRDRDQGVTEQTINGDVSLQPTPNWEMSWGTAYNFEEGQFESQDVTLTRDLHRWQADFQFSRATNGNFRFAFRISLRDAEQVRFDYDQLSDID
jgi:hypothetical protein